MRKLLAITVCMLMVLALIAGCSEKGTDTTGGTETSNQVVATESSSETNAQSTEGASSEAKSISIASISPSEANNARFIQGVKDKAEEYGWTVSVTDAHGSADEANAAFQNFVTKGSDFIIDMVFPTTSLATGLKATKDANIPVGTWGGGMGDGVYVTNGSGGPHAIPIVKKMVEDMNSEGEVLALTYHTGEVARERETELDKILADYPNIKVTKNEVRIPGYLQDGAQYANAWLAARPEGAANYAIWGSWDDPALGAISALKQQGRKDVKVYGENGNADAILAIKDGWMTATAWQDSYSEGVKMVEVFKEISESKGEWTPIAAEIDPVVVTAENVDQFIADHPEAVENVSNQ